LHSIRLMPGIAAFLLMGAALWPLSAIAEGALAVGITANRGANGFAVGFSTNWVNAAVAHREALRRCMNNADSEAVKSLCAVISDIHRECVVYAGSDSAFGWGIDPDLEVAKRQALEMCQSMAGADSFECKVTLEKRFDACDQSDRGR
jgi:hypothetical protein